MQKSICPELGMLLRPRPGMLCRSQRKHRPPRRMQTPCRPPAALRMLGSATQSLSAAGPASLEAEPEASRTLDHSGPDAQTVATLHSAESIIRSARKEDVIKVADQLLGMAHDELVRNSDNSKYGKRGEDTFINWCNFVGISRSTAYQLLQVSDLLESSTPNEQKILKQASPSLLYAAARPSAEPEAVAALEGGDITTHKQYKELEAQLKAEREAREKAATSGSRTRPQRQREDAHAAALRYKAEADRRAQDQNRLEGLVQTVDDMSATAPVRHWLPPSCGATS